jgi:hypothetical protein
MIKAGQAALVNNAHGSAWNSMQERAEPMVETARSKPAREGNDEESGNGQSNGKYSRKVRVTALVTRPPGK